MIYIVFEIQTNANGTIGTLVSTYEDRNEAEQKYHLVLSSAAVSQLPSHAAVLMANEGQVLDRKCYHHIQPEPEPEPEGETGE